MDDVALKNRIRKGEIVLKEEYIVLSLEDYICQEISSHIIGRIGPNGGSLEPLTAIVCSVDSTEKLESQMMITLMKMISYRFDIFTFPFIRILHV